MIHKIKAAREAALGSKRPFIIRGHDFVVSFTQMSGLKLSTRGFPFFKLVTLFGPNRALGAEPLVLRRENRHDWACHKPIPGRRGHLAIWFPSGPEFEWRFSPLKPPIFA